MNRINSITVPSGLEKNTSDPAFRMPTQAAPFSRRNSLCFSIVAGLQVSRFFGSLFRDFPSGSRRPPLASLSSATGGR